MHKFTLKATQLRHCAEFHAAIEPCLKEAAMPSTTTNRQDCVQWPEPEATWLGLGSQSRFISFCRLLFNATTVILTMMASRSVCGSKLTLQKPYLVGSRIVSITSSFLSLSACTSIGRSTMSSTSATYRPTSPRQTPASLCSLPWSLERQPMRIDILSRLASAT
jgi:hypothetical protein